jgi:predicted YcjX-like family ATPase
MPEFENTEHAKPLLDTKEFAQYEAAFVEFYEAQKAVLEAMALSYLDPQSKEFLSDLKVAVGRLGASFRQCMIEILDSSRDANEFSADLADFIINDEETRLTELSRLLADPTKQSIKYKRYNRDGLDDRIRALYVNSEGVSALSGHLVDLYTSNLHSDLHTALFAIQGGEE